MSEPAPGEAEPCQVNLSTLPQLLETLRPALLRTARQIDPRDAEDAVQEALASALRNYGQFKGRTDSDLRGWLRTIVRNACLSRLRKRRETPGVELASNHNAVVAAESPSGAARRDDERACLIGLLADLLDAEREVVLMRYFENWSLKMISGHMNRTEHAVAGLLKRALAKLRAKTSPSQWSQLLDN